MKVRHRLVCAGCVGLSLLTGSGCGSTERAGAAAGDAAAADVISIDPSVRLLLRPSGMLVENLEVQGQPGVARAFDVRGTSNHVVLSFTARGEVPELKDLGAYAAWADGMLKEREIRDVDLRGMRNPIEEAGLAFVARSYVNKRGAAGAVCDAAGVRFETPGGFWTITWNADLGKIEASMPVIREVLRVMEIERVGGGVVAAGPAAVLSPGSPAPALEVREWIRGAPIDAMSAEGTYVVEFWATWCGPCAESIPHLTEMAKAHANVRFVGISVLEDNDKQQVQEFVAKMSDAMGYTVGYSGNTDGMARTWMAAARQRGIPTAFLVQRGRVMWIGHPMQLKRPLEQLARGELDVDAELKAFEAKLSAQDAAAARIAAVEECARLFDAGEREAAKAALAKIEETAAGKSAGEPLRMVWLCVEEPRAWREKMVAGMEASKEEGSEFALFAVNNAGRAPEECRWLVGELTTRFPDNWYTWLCGARMARALGDWDGALAYAERARGAVLAYQARNPEAPKGNALDVIGELEEDVRGLRGR